MYINTQVVLHVSVVVELFPVRPSHYESGVSVVKCLVDECYMISCWLLSAGLNTAVVQEQTVTSLMPLHWKNKTTLSFY